MACHVTCKLTWVSTDCSTNFCEVLIRNMLPSSPRGAALGMGRATSKHSASQPGDPGKEV